MMQFEKKEGNITKILAFTPAKGSTMDSLRAIKGIVAKRNNLPLESIIMRYNKEAI